jgi:hypothetical protein
MNAVRIRPEILCDNLKNLVTGHFIRFLIDNLGLIESVTYLGNEEVSIQSLLSFVGLSESYLNKLDQRYNHLAATAH